MAGQPDDPFAHTRMTLGEHLGELRTRLARGLAAVVILFVGALFFTDQITEIVLRPHRRQVAELNAEYRRQAEALVAEKPELRDKYFEPDGTYRREIDDRLKVFSPTEGMWFALKVCGYFALFVGSPFLLWQLWGFVAAGLYERERRWVRWFFPPALVLFLLGVLFSYFILVPYGLYYLLKSMPIELLTPDLRLEYYFSFVATLALGMGAVFQLPMLMTFVSTVGLVEPATFAGLRKYFLIAAFVVAAVLTPGPDIFSQVTMALPMVLLYEIGILGARVMAGRARRATKAKVAGA